MSNKDSETPRPSRVVRFLAILCLLLGIAVVVSPNFIRHRGGSLTVCKSNLKNIGTGLEMYSTDWAGHYPRNLHLLTPNYLKTLPACPRAGYVTYRYQTGLNCAYNTGLEDYYFLECAGTHHANISLPPNYPQYDGIQGLVVR